MHLQVFRDLISPAGQEVLQAAESGSPSEADFLADFQRLSRKYPQDLARAALEIAVLRREAAGKFPFSDRMYFTREALEQASPQEVSEYRSQRYRPFRLLTDLGCSVGGDTLSLAEISPTLGIDRDPLRLAMARANLAALGLDRRVQLVQADLAQADLSRRSLPLAARPDLAWFFDPARRAGGVRVFSIRDYQPPLDLLPGWLRRIPAGGVKVSPGVRLDELQAFDAEVEFISLRGELKEATLWFGPFRSTRRRATLLPGPHTLAADPGQVPPSRLSEPRAVLYEPDPAIIRAGLVTSLAEQLNASQLDEDIAYLTADANEPTPFARAWLIEAWLPFGLKRLRAYLRERKVGKVVVKKRGSPLQPEALIQDLRLQGDAERVIFLTHLRGRPIVVICHP